VQRRVAAAAHGEREVHLVAVVHDRGAGLDDLDARVQLRVLTNVQRTVSPAATLMLAVRVATTPVLSPSVQVIDDSR